MDVSVYLNPEALAGWQKKMNSINSKCCDDIDGIKDAIDNINGSFEGDYSEKFQETLSSYLAMVKSKHEYLENVSNFLAEVVDTCSSL